MTRAFALTMLLGFAAACTPLPAPITPADAVCDALRPALPSWSSQDTAQSKTEGARFLDVWQAVCEEA